MQTLLIPRGVHHYTCKTQTAKERVRLMALWVASAAIRCRKDFAYRCSIVKRPAIPAGSVYGKVTARCRTVLSCASTQ